MTKQQLSETITEYYTRASALDADKWAEMFAANGVVEDPVGGKRIKGREGLRKFFPAMTKELASLTMKPMYTVIIPPEVVVWWSYRAQTKKGMKLAVDGISTFVFDDEMKIAEMRAFWDLMDMKATPAP